MNAARQFYAQNSQLVQNAVYLLVLGVVCYMVYTYLTAGNDVERYVVQVNMTGGVYGIPGNANNSLVPLERRNAMSNAGPFPITSDLNNPDSQLNPAMRIQAGADFTFSWWMYISTWDNTRMGVIKPIVAISDKTVSNPVLGQNAAYILVAFLYPNTNMMGVRVHTVGGTE